MITVRPLVYTSHPAEWHSLASALSFTPHQSDGADWSVVAASGLLAIHAVPDDDPLAGTTELQILVDDLDAATTRIDDAGVETERFNLDDGVTPLVRVATDDGIRVSLLPGATATAGPLRVQPIWYRTEIEPAPALLAAIGLQPRIASDSGDWIDYTADGGGMVALHHRNSPGIELSLQTDDPEALAQRLVAARIGATVVDEAYNRTVLVPSPDSGELWINGPIDDLHGFRHLATQS